MGHVREEHLVRAFFYDLNPNRSLGMAFIRQKIHKNIKNVGLMTD